MLTTPTFALPYPEDDDHAAWALQIQAQAEAIDAQLVALNAALDRATDQPVVMQRATSNLTMSSVYPTTYQLTNLSPYYSSGNAGFSGSFGQFVGDYAGGTFRPGIYGFGCWVHVAATGVVTVGSVRNLFVDVIDYRGSDSAAYYESFIDQKFDRNTGGTEHNLTFTMPLYSPNFSATMRYYHSNAGSAVNILSGTTAWMYRIGDLI